METLHYTLALLVSFSGLFIGLSLARIAKEELRQGERYFRALSLGYPQHIYAVLGFIFFWASMQEFFLLIASIIFFYGFVIGTLCSMEFNQDKIKKTFMRYVHFLVIGILLYLFFGG